MNSRLAAGLLLAGLFSACSSGPEMETRTFELRHVNPEEARALIEPYVYGRPDYPGMVSTSRAALTVRETADNLDQIERMLAQFDQPPQAVRLFFQLIEADGARTTDPAIADVETELRKLFRFEGYRLMSEATVTVMGISSIEQRLFDQRPVQGRWASFDLRGAMERPRGTGDSTQATLHIELSPESQSPLFSAQVLVSMGKTIVLGTTRLPGGVGIILTVRAELAD